MTREVSLGVDVLHSLAKDVGYREADVALGLTTMQRRAALLGSAYPFIAGVGVAARQTAAERTWTALLLMSAESPIRPSLDIPIAAAHLERIATAALTSIYGPGTSAVRFAWPSEDGRPAEFPEAIRWLAERMRVPLGTSYRSPYAKDGGVDVVAWRPFPDGRSGFPVLLGQCTLERDYTHKARDVDVRVWSGWLALDIDPQTALAIPEVVAPGEEWNALAATTVVLDRLRLASLIGGREEEHDRLVPVVRWTEEQLARLKDTQ